MNECLFTTIGITVIVHSCDQCKVIIDYSHFTNINGIMGKYMGMNSDELLVLISKREIDFHCMCNYYKLVR